VRKWERSAAVLMMMMSETTWEREMPYTTAAGIPRCHNFSLLHYIEGQDATLRGAKDDLNLKENKTNTSQTKLKPLTEDSNQQPVKRKTLRKTPTNNQ
jgi:hypothetical protein